MEKIKNKKMNINPVILLSMFLIIVISILNYMKLSEIQELGNLKNKRLCDNSSKEILANIIDQEKKTGKIIVKNKEEAFLKLNVKCLYDQGYNVKGSESTENLKK